jgi:hypothetical protein
MALRRALRRRDIGVKTASGRILRTPSIFSGSPPTKMMGMWRVALEPRRKTATSFPCEGSRDKSMTMALGGEVWTSL